VPSHPFKAAAHFIPGCSVRTRSAPSLVPSTLQSLQQVPCQPCHSKPSPKVTLASFTHSSQDRHGAETQASPEHWTCFSKSFSNVPEFTAERSTPSHWCKGERLSSALDPSLLLLCQRHHRHPRLPERQQGAGLQPHPLQARVPTLMDQSPGCSGLKATTLAESGILSSTLRPSSFCRILPVEVPGAAQSQPFPGVPGAPPGLQEHIPTKHQLRASQN
jgi:hypothetical protein